MKLFKTENNEIFAYEEDGSQDHLIGNKIAITQEEADVINTDKELAKFNSLTYAKKRVAEYPPITDYIDGIVKGDNAQIQAYIDACLAVKAKYPKGTA